MYVLFMALFYFTKFDYCGQNQINFSIPIVHLIYSDRKTDRQTDGQTERQADKETDRQRQ